MTIRGSTTGTARGTDRTTCARAARRASGAVRAGVWAASARAASWTGRAVASRATDSGLPPFVTAGTHRTRVSEMRDAAPRRARAVVHLHAATGAAAAPPSPTERSALGRARLPPRRSG